MTVEPVDTTTAAFVGSARDQLVAAAQHFFANGGTRLLLLHVADFDDDPEAAFARLDGTDVSLVASPGCGSAAAIEAGARYCERRADCFFLADPPAGAGPAEVRGLADSVRSSYAALYMPWLNPRSPAPPSGFVAGVLARSPVWRASAGSALSGATGLTDALSDDDRASLHALGVNTLRISRTGEITVGADHTLSPPAQAEWKYVSVRRTALFLEESIDEGTQWVVFEPNEEPLWSKLRGKIDAFLATQWRLGAFQGTEPDEAYFVKCDRTTMTQADIDSGTVIVVVGFAPLKPAEFVNLRIGLKAARDDPDP